MKRIVFVFITAILVSACSQGDKDSFHFNLEKGKTYHFDRRYLINEHYSETTSEVFCAYTAEVTDVNENFRTLKITCGNHRLVKTSGDTNVRVTGDTVNAMQLQDVYDKVNTALNGKSFFIKVNPSGKLAEVTGLKQLVFPVIDSMRITNELKNSAKQFFITAGEPLIARQFMQGFDIFPERDIKKGDSWQKERQQDGIVPIDVNTTYTVKDISGGKVYLRVKALMNDNGRKGELLGDYVVDRKSGLLLDAEIKTQFGIPVLISTSEKLSGRYADE